jgi:predicted enzyme related to lactoylglutathione lyase
MASKDFEVQQLLKAHRNGLISDKLFTQQMDEMCAGANGQGAATTPTPPVAMRSVTGDAGLDAPGGMAMLTAGGKTYDRTAEDLGNIVALEHVNVTVPDQGKAALFYINGLGLTRDPYMMTGPANMWVNVGRQQFHLPGGKPQVVRGHVGVVISDYAALPQRLGRIGEALAGTRFAFHERDDHIEALCPWGNRLRCFAPNRRFGPMAVGIPYVEFDVPVGAADGIARFYSQILGAQAAPQEDEHGRFTCVTAGTGQNLYFRETAQAIQPYDRHHIQIYINDFSGPHRRLAAKGLIVQESDQHQYRFQDIVDPDSGKALFTIEHEVRSMKHPLYLRPLVNRNPSQSIMRYAPGEDGQNWAMALN